MKSLTTKASLDGPLARLIEIMQVLNFGRIENLQVRNGHPAFEPPPHITQKLKMGGDNAPRPEAGYTDFRLKDGVVDLLQIIEHLSDGEIRSIEVRCGLPVSVEIEWPLGAPPSPRGANE